MPETEPRRIASTADRVSLRKDCKVIRTTLLVTAASCAAAPAPAQSQDPIRQLQASFESVDGDGDGVITRDEYRSVQLARWTQIDRNGDGHLTEEDFPRFAAERARTLLAENAHLDADGNGRISQTEFVDGQPPVFRRADRNGDGVLTRTEVEATAS